MSAPYTLAQKHCLLQAVAQAMIQITEDLGKYALALASLLKYQI